MGNLGELQSLTSLNLSECDSLVELPPSLGKLQSLTSLDLAGCGKLSDEVKDSLKAQAAANKVRQYLAAIQEGKPMREVNLSGDASDEIVALLVNGLDVVACESLVIRSNDILTVLPPNLSRLRSLTSLYLGGCRSLSELPPSLGELQSLTSLNLKHCSSLSELPSNLGRLQSLTSLNLSECSLSELPPSLSELQSLTSLDLKKCDCRKLSREAKNSLTARVAANTMRQYLAAIQEGKPMREATVSRDASNEDVALLVNGLDVVACESLVIKGNKILTVLPPNLGRLQSLASLFLNCQS